MSEPPVSSPVTIGDWRAVQTPEHGLAHLLALVEQERALGSTAWITLASPQQLRQQWEGSSPDGPLYGVPFAVKDNIDVVSFVTTAACPAFSDTPATEDAPVVARLKAAGAIVVGKTNLDQFATGLVGTRSPYGAVPNSFDPSRVSGGSSSGSAVVVARGVVPFSFGTDTAGSGRVPAGFNNVIGLKPTRGALSARGVVPACRTLDCVSIFAHTVVDAETVLAVAEGYDAKDAYSRTRPSAVPSSLFPDPTRASPLVAICANPPWFGRTEQEQAYNAALDQARRLGWRLQPVDFTLLFALAQLLYEGPWVAERYQAIGPFMESTTPDGTPCRDSMDPVVRGILDKARNFTAADAFASTYRRQELTCDIERGFAAFDLLLVPTAPTFPTMDEVAREPVRENANLGTYTNFVNFLDWSALGVPAGFRSDGLPFGVTLIAREWQESALLQLGLRWLSGEPRRLGATTVYRTEPGLAHTKLTTANAAVPNGVCADDSSVDIVVVGAHMSGLPLNGDLVSRGAQLRGPTKTSKAYRLYALAPPSTKTQSVAKPGLKRVLAGTGGDEPGKSIDVEVWRLPANQFAGFLATIPHPLGIGSVELDDGSWKHGFICEPAGLDGALDITAHGGWRAYLASLSSTSAPELKIQRVLIANRGEIAVRIIRTLHTMGIEAVAIYSTADANAPHVHDADIALSLGAGSVADTYLNGARILELARSADVAADAVIPGYGFLAENADFAAAVEAAGLAWIGPTPDQMRRLGLKHEARALAVAAGVPVVPGSTGDSLLANVDEALTVAADVGYPVMLKSTAGGGGIGLQRCNDADALRAAFDGVQSLATANFGDGRVFVERFVVRSRHIEVQIIGDGTGCVWAAGERDCSLQRRHQKLVEESPAPGLPDSVRQRMRQAAMDLAASVKYRSVGTVEFLFDVDDGEAFYFLEVNTRLQVEHPVTEAVTGLDLVEVMVRLAVGDASSIEAAPGSCVPLKGASIEVRLYAESPLQGFRPSAGHILDVCFPPHVRVDTWVAKGTEVTALYDSLVAKIIASGEDRAAAVQQLLAALKQTKLVGFETNLDYLAAIVASDVFVAGSYATDTLDTAAPLLASHVLSATSVVEVLEAGPATTVQDYPGRMGLWHAGIPPSGPMDSYSFRLANRAVGNASHAPALEATLQGPSLRFLTATVAAVTGATADVLLDGEKMPMNTPLSVKAGQMLRVGAAQAGYRMYVAVRGGFDVPLVLGSRSTFAIGQLGGHNGRPLQNHDVLKIGHFDDPSAESVTSVPATPIPTESSPIWHLAVVPGPHGAPDFLTDGGFAALFTDEWAVHYNSNRLGVRLTGPKPQWARKDGGQGGLHPSNIHDAPYSIGSISFTGDQAIVLTCDGPSLGGFVAFCVIATADLWKLGQAQPGHRIRLHPVTTDQATDALNRLDSSVATLSAFDSEWMEVGTENGKNARIPDTIVGTIGSGSSLITVRQAGDCGLLLEFGGENVFDIVQSLAIFSLIEYHNTHPILGVEELSPGVRTLHILYQKDLRPDEVVSALTAAATHISSLPAASRKVKSRRVRMPIAFRDSASKRAVTRYADTIRANAPYLPDNVEFLREINGLEQAGVEACVGAAEFLVLGLGDVYLGSPCAVALDPRHRLVGTKYNPSRSYTPRSAVGLGGQYMCIYGGESPGGYMLVGRTAPVWNELKVEYGTNEVGIDKLSLEPSSRPWLLQVFDRISFYPVDEAALRTSEVQVDEEAEFDVEAYEAWLHDIQDEVEQVAAQRRATLMHYPRLNELLTPPPLQAAGGILQAGTIVLPGDAAADEPLRKTVQAGIPGRCFKCAVSPGHHVNEGETLLWMESNKMELQIRSPATGTVTAVYVAVGDLIAPADVLAVLSLQ